MSLHLSSDSNTRVNIHTNELVARTGIVIFLWMIATIAWLLNINNLVEYFVAIFNPCTGDCLNLYQPEKWSELRWIVAAFLGLLSITPIINLQIWVFSKPGLTDSEQRMLRLVLLLAPVLFLIASYVTIAELLPKLYSIGHAVHSDYGFVTKYDAVSLIYFAMTLLWIQTLVVISSAVMVCSGLTGNLDSSNANWWRLRVYGFTSLVSILSHYDRTTNGMIITLATIFVVELISRPWTTKSPKYDVKLRRSFTEEGEIISNLELVCGCVNGPIPQAEQCLTIQDVCTDKFAHEDLIRIVDNLKPSKISVYCCNKYPVWDRLSNLYQGIEIIVNTDDYAAIEPTFDR